MLVLSLSLILALAACFVQALSWPADFAGATTVEGQRMQSLEIVAMPSAGSTLTLRNCDIDRLTVSANRVLPDGSAILVEGCALGSVSMLQLSFAGRSSLTIRNNTFRQSPSSGPLQPLLQLAAANGTQHTRIAVTNCSFVSTSASFVVDLVMPPSFLSVSFCNNNISALLAGGSIVVNLHAVADVVGSLINVSGNVMRIDADGPVRDNRAALLRVMTDGFSSLTVDAITMDSNRITHDPATAVYEAYVIDIELYAYVASVQLVSLSRNVVRKVAPIRDETRATIILQHIALRASLRQHTGAARVGRVEACGNDIDFHGTGLRGITVETDGTIGVLQILINNNSVRSTDFQRFVGVECTCDGNHWNTSLLDMSGNILHGVVRAGSSRFAATGSYAINMASVAGSNTSMYSNGGVIRVVDNRCSVASELDAGCVDFWCGLWNVAAVIVARNVFNVVGLPMRVSFTEGTRKAIAVRLAHTFRTVGLFHFDSNEVDVTSDVAESVLGFTVAMVFDSFEIGEIRVTNNTARVVKLAGQHTDYAFGAVSVSSGAPSRDLAAVSVVDNRFSLYSAQVCAASGCAAVSVICSQPFVNIALINVTGNNISVRANTGGAAGIHITVSSAAYDIGPGARLSIRTSALSMGQVAVTSNTVRLTGPAAHVAALLLMTCSGTLSVDGISVRGNIASFEIPHVALLAAVGAGCPTGWMQIGSGPLAAVPLDIGCTPQGNNITVGNLDVSDSVFGGVSGLLHVRSTFRLQQMRVTNVSVTGDVRLLTNDESWPFKAISVADPGCAIRSLSVDGLRVVAHAYCPWVSLLALAMLDDAGATLLVRNSTATVHCHRPPRVPFSMSTISHVSDPTSMIVLASGLPLGGTVVSWSDFIVRSASSSSAIASASLSVQLFRLATPPLTESRPQLNVSFLNVVSPSGRVGSGNALIVAVAGSSATPPGQVDLSVGCVTWDGAPVASARSAVLRGAASFLRMQRLIPCKGAAVSVTASRLRSRTKSDGNWTRTAVGTRTCSESPAAPDMLPGLSQARLDALASAAAGGTIASAIAGDPGALLSGANGVALMRLAICALQHAAHPARPTPEMLANATKRAMLAAVPFPNSLLPGLRVGRAAGSALRGAIVGYVLLLLVSAAVAYFAAVRNKSMWVEFVHDRQRHGTLLHVVAPEEDPTLDYAPLDRTVLKAVAATVALCGETAARLVAGSPNGGGDVALGVVPMVCCGLLCAVWGRHVYSEIMPRAVVAAVGAGSPQSPSSSPSPSPSRLATLPDSLDEELLAGRPARRAPVERQRTPRAASASPRRGADCSHNNSRMIAVQPRSVACTQPLVPRHYCEPSAVFAPHGAVSGISCALRGLLQSKVGRWFLTGDVVWHSPFVFLEQSATLPGPGLLTRFASVLGAFQGPLRCDVSSPATPRDSSSSSNSNRRSQDRGWQSHHNRRRPLPLSQPQPRQYYDTSLRRRLGPSWIFCSIIQSLVVAMLAGSGLAQPDMCAQHFVGALVVCALSLLGLLALRPHVVAARLVLAVTIELCTVVGGLVFVAVLQSGGDGGDDGALPPAAVAQSVAAIIAAELLCTLPASILGPVLTALPLLRFAAMRVARAMTVALSTARRHLPQELDRLEEELFATPVMQAARRNRPGPRPQRERAEARGRDDSSATAAHDHPTTPTNGAENSAHNIRRPMPRASATDAVTPVTLRASCTHVTC